MTNVLQLRKPNTNPSEMLTYTDDEMPAGIRLEIIKYVRAGGTFTSLAKKCNYSPCTATISRIYYGKNKRSPYWLTMLILFNALGFRVKAVSVSQRSEV